jgi:hypothetical protein
MKKIALLMTLMLLLSMSVAIAEPALKATLLRQEPLPAEPGQYVTVYVELENEGSDDATNAAIEFVDEFPFTVVSSDKRENLGVLKSQQSYVADFRIRVDSSAPIGDNSLTIRYTSDVNSANWVERNLDVEVNSNDASLAITKVDVNPEEIAAGEAGAITLSVQNNADIVLRDISLQLKLKTTSGTTTTDLPFIPTSSVTEKRINRLNVGETKDITFDVKAYPSAEPGYYKLPLEMTYFDDQGSEATSSDYVGVIVEAKPELKILVENSQLRTIGEAGTITLQFINKGIHDLKFLDVNVQESDSYEVLSSSTAYIGDLDSDDFRTEEYTIIATDENAQMQVAVEYRDQNNKMYSEIVNVPILFNKVPQQNGGSSGTVIFVVIVLAIVGYVVFRRYKKNKKR